MSCLHIVGIALCACTIFVNQQSIAHAYRYRHDVLPGETLSDIAQRYGTTVRQLKRDNGIDGSNIVAGQKLTVVTKRRQRALRRRRRYTVRRGDRMRRIARRFNMSVRLLKRMNPQAEPRNLQPGQVLWVVSERSSSKKLEPKHTLYRLHEIPEGGYQIRNEGSSWGTLLTLTRLQEVCTAHAAAFPDAGPLHIWDISREGGGYFPPHLSHKSGRDVDIPYPLKSEKKVRTVTAATLDVERTWFIIEKLLETEDIVYIFVDRRIQRILFKYVQKLGVPKELLSEVFQYPRGANSRKGIIRHAPGHADHFHVRFRKEDPSFDLVT